MKKIKNILKKICEITFQKYTMSYILIFANIGQLLLSIYWASKEQYLHAIYCMLFAIFIYLQLQDTRKL